ncbi:hypothetical protein LCGC14_1031260 [marine sediment metagenome]|uniref:HEPN domain-containing protein n=1 Tax=marine sediment metagenome TaxID=412755 RepID=A0A0F9NGB5_9ZZZZ
MEKIEKYFRPKRLREWLMYASIYQSRKICRQGSKFARKILLIFEQNIKEELKKWS